MPYISSNENRLYAALEPSFGQVPPIGASNRLLAVELQAHQQLQASVRRDKTGTRTFLGFSPLFRRATAFSIDLYLSSWNSVDAPSYAALLQSALGGTVTYSNNLIVQSMPDPLHVITQAPHGLSAGAGISQGTDIRFVANVVDQFTIQVTAPFASTLAAGVTLSPCLTYNVGNSLPSVSLFDYWDPATAIQRIISGATVDSLNIALNGAYHEMTFAGLAADVGDSNTFTAGWGGLASYPVEPTISSSLPSVVPGNLGEVWMGITAAQLFSLTEAQIVIKNNLVPRNMEFGTIYPSSIAAGPRDVSLNFSVFAEDSSLVESLYSAAKQRTTTSVMFQLGRQEGQIMGVYMPSVALEMPYYDDKEPRLIWQFKSSRAQGLNNDEIFVALA